MLTTLQRIAAGDADAVKECIDQYGGLLWSIARRFNRVTAEAEDAVQDSFVAVWRNAERFDPDIASEKTFITMIARRKMIDRLRKAERRPKLQPLPETGPDPSGDQHLRMVQSAEAAAAAELLDDLRPEQKRVIELSIYYGMSHREIAEEVDMPIGTVKSHIFRGLALVRENLAQAEGGVA